MEDPCITCRFYERSALDEPCMHCAHYPPAKHPIHWEPRVSIDEATPAEWDAASAAANARQVGGDHYISNAIQPWDYIASNGIGYFEGNVIKYVSRWRDKGGVADLEKARHYLDKLIELERK